MRASDGGMSAPVLSTSRFRLHRYTTADAAALLQLMTDPDYLRFIGDRGLRTVDDAQVFITERLRPAYAQHGWGLYRVTDHQGQDLGMCGLVHRDSLPGPDLGFALLPAARGQGVIRETGAAVLGIARGQGLWPLYAITDPDNHASARVLEHLGFARTGTTQVPDDPLLLDLWCTGDP